ncbi:MAG: phage holin family protein [Bacteroidota bacterium]|jgi:putative membrane protein
MNFLTKLLISTLAVAFAAYILPGVSIDRFTTAILVALVISVLNFFLRPLLILLTLPVTVFTLGLFLIVINAIIILIATEWVDGFKVESFGYAVLFSVVLSLTTSILESFNKKPQPPDDGQFRM